MTLDFIQSATIGQKDSQKSLFFLWQSIFQLPRPKKKRFALLSKTPVPEANILPGLGLGNTAHPPEITSSAARFYNMLHLASSNGQYNKLENGRYNCPLMLIICLKYVLKIERIAFCIKEFLKII